MSRERAARDAIDKELSRIEFPGEDELWLRSHLQERGFVDRVMKAVAQTHVRLSRATVWGSIGLLNVAIIVVAGTNPHLVEDVLALRRELFTFFYSFLALTLAGCIVGVVLSVDLSRIEPFFANLFKDFSLDRIRNLFRHPR